MEDPRRTTATQIDKMAATYSRICLFPAPANPLLRMGVILAFVCGSTMFFPHSLANAQLCDIDGDGLCNNLDMRVLYEDIALAAGPGPSDISLDGMVDNRDICFWLADAGRLNLSRPYRKGDADLNGFVDANDFEVWRANYGAYGLPDAYWEHGNFDGSQAGVFDVDGADFLIWQTGGIGACSVPEPNALILLAIGGLLALTARSRLSGRHARTVFC